MKQKGVLLTAIVLSFAWSIPTPVHANSSPPFSHEKRVNLESEETIAFQEITSSDDYHPTRSKPLQSVADFLQGPSPLTKTSKERVSREIEDSIEDHLPNSLLVDYRTAKRGEVADEDCHDRTGNGRKYIHCVKQYSDGSFTKTVHQIIEHPHEHKKQIVITDFDSEGTRVNRKSIRHKTVFTLFGDREAEYFDVVTRPYRGKITREFLIRHYEPRSQQTTKLLWTKYRQIRKELFAEITHHAVLSFDVAGKPLKGRAEKWNKGVVTDTLRSWNRQQNPHFRLEKTNWRLWENRIKTVMQQVSVL